MSATIREEARQTPVFREVDVLVAGGGLAGCAAAVAAARAGAKTVLLERNGCLGGVATASLMANIGNRYTIRDGEQVVKGIAGEVVDRLVNVGAASPNWRDHNGIPMDSERLKVVLVEMLQEAGAQVLTHSMAAQPILEGQAVLGCFFESKSGRKAVLAANTVDCTGEADLAHRAGAETHEHRASSSLLFKLANVNVDKFVDFLGEDPEGYPVGMDWIKDYDEMAQRWRRDSVFFFPHHGGKKWRWGQQMMDKVGYGEKKKNNRWMGPADNIDAFGMYTHRRDGTVVVNTGYYCFDKIEIGEFSDFELQAQQLCYYAADFLIRNVPGFENARVEHVGVDLGMRGGRFITGRSRLKTADLHGSKTNVLYDDVIATTGVESDVPGERPGALGATCDVPFGSCVPPGVGRLLVGSGKSVDTEGGNKRLYRGMSGCMVYGQATGTAAALAAKKGVAVGDLPVRDLQRELLRLGVRLGDAARLKDLGLA